MKRLNLIFLLIGLTVFLGCQKDNTLTTEPNQSDETSYKAQKTPFIGHCNIIELISDGDTTFLPNGKIKITGFISKWKDTADDPRVTGVSTWYMNWLIDTDGTVKTWGKADIVVDDDGGLWRLTFHGTQTPTFDEGGNLIGFLIEDVCNGVGKEGEVKGLTAKWWHEMNWVFSDPSTFVYYFHGHIKE